MRSLILAALLVGCAPGKADNRVELWTNSLKPTFTTYVEGVLAAYTEKTGVAVEWVDVPANAIENKLLAAVASGDPPDLVNLNPSFTAKLADQGGLTQLDQSLPAGLKDQYFSGPWGASVLAGATYGLPWYLSTAITIFNKDFTNQAPRTFDEALTLGRQIKAKQQKPLWMPNFGDRGKFAEALEQDGVALMDQAGNPAFQGQVGVKALTKWVTLYKEGIIPKESLTQGHREAIDRFQSGELALLTTGPQFLKQVKENAPQLYGKLGVGPQLTGDAGYLGVGVMNLVVPKGSQHVKEAIDLGAFITNGPNQLAFTKLAAILPSVKEAMKEFGASDGSLEGEARKVSASQLPQSRVLVPPMSHHAERMKALDTALQKACLGEKSPKDALEEAAAAWKKL